LAKKQTELSDKSSTLTSLESRMDEIIEKRDEIAQKENEIGHTISLNNTLVSDWLKRLEYISQKRKSIDVQIDDTKKQTIKNES
jgi:chromosome segregation ATPase